MLSGGRRQRSKYSSILDAVCKVADSEDVWETASLIHDIILTLNLIYSICDMCEQ